MLIGWQVAETEDRMEKKRRPKCYARDAKAQGFEGINMHDARKVPERPRSTGPALWLIRNDASARRLRLTEGTLRTTIGFDTIISRHVDEIRLSDAIRFEVLAPYSRSTPRLSMIIFGLSLGMILGSQFQPGDALVLAIMTVTFSLVATVVGRQTTASQRIARIEMLDGRAYTVAYQIEDESDIRRLFGDGRWVDANMTQASTPLRPEEERLAEKMRYGTLLMAGSLSIIVLMMVITDGSGLSDSVTIPVNIVYLAVLGFSLMFSAIAWYKMTRAGMRK